MGYGDIAFIVFWGLILKVWIKYGPKIPLPFVGIFAVGYLVMPHLSISSNYFALLVCFMAITLLLIDRFKSTPRR